jgi:restriction system protein
MFSGLPGVSPRVFDLEYIPAEKLLIVDHGLPSPDDLMRRGEPGKAGNEFLAGLYAENNFHLVYENIVYQMCLRTIYELFMADTAGALDVVVFNGWVEARTIKTKGCVLSVQAAKEEFLKLNLARVDPKLGFKSLNGQGSDTLASLTPITPIKKSARD